MRALVAFGAALVTVVLAAACGGTRTVVRTVTVERTAPAASTADQRLYGRIVSLRRAAGGYELRFDPAWFLSGIAANVAQAEDQGTQCVPSSCPPVANDNYVVDEGHRIFTYILPADARGTVLTRGHLDGVTITAAQLAGLVAGTSPLRLFEPLSSGVWIAVHIDTVRTFVQQYHP